MNCSVRRFHFQPVRCLWSWTVNRKTTAHLFQQQRQKGVRVFQILGRRHINMKPHLDFICQCKTKCDCSDTTMTGRRRMNTHSTLYSQSDILKGNVINGKAIAEQIRQEIKDEVDRLIKDHPKKRKPHLSVVLVGNDPSSIIYVRNKARTAAAAGMTCDILRLPRTVTQDEILEEINVLNEDKTIDGVLVQLPLPAGVNERFICDSVLPEKDVDGFSVLNIGRFCVDEQAFIPATPLGVLEILKRLKVDTLGKNAVVCGRSKNVGLPIALHLQASTNGGMNAGNATTTICHRHTPPDKLKTHTQNADILITATGIPGLITGDMVKDGAVVIDIGITRVRDAHGKHRLVGDVDFEGVKPKASLITPVPGGVGPVTVVMVLKNTLMAYKKEIDFYQTAAHRISNPHS